MKRDGRGRRRRVGRAGLTINTESKDLSNTWIKSHLAKNFELTNEQAGFLYVEILANFSMLNIYDALSRRHDSDDYLNRGQVGQANRCV